ncbi:MAG: 50S ribosomal protein L18 [Armatimonadota bacterium]|nr:50S ribosomal protein L18 [Armatimonadota bacterium]MDR5675205.1 50S ribosomal protein L18 [Armatimonadota bacterium]MDR5690160.1 50S ribosomal protein L18 [Armatimonadota bacterium]MDR7389772.1 50S ribosomal protein L18 [Armatimonadota bacterium]MDR7392671.1 50S ribosomal protein L18 [Armatimonadota bacterium]
MLLRISREERRKIRHRRIRQRVVGTPDRPRLSVFRSLKHTYAQIIDDTRGHTLVAASTREPEIAAQLSGLKRVEQSRVVGRVLAERAREKGIVRVVFDRGGYAYHGRVKALAEGAREGGLEF